MYQEDPRNGPVNIVKSGQPVKRRKRGPSTEGEEWLLHSFTAFNGTGYADYSSPAAFVESYIAYKKWKKQLDAVQLAIDHIPELTKVAERLLKYSKGPGQVPNYKKLMEFRQQSLL